MIVYAVIGVPVVLLCIDTGIEEKGTYIKLTYSKRFKLLLGPYIIA